MTSPKQIQVPIASALIFVVALILMLTQAALGASKEEGKNRDDYLALVKGYAAFMLAHGRDTYGSKSTPLFVNTLNLETREMPSASNEATDFLYRNLFRQSVRFSTASNPMMQVNLFQLLYALSEVTRDRKYQEAANAAISGWPRVAPNFNASLLGRIADRRDDLRFSVHARER